MPHLPDQFNDLLQEVIAFADPALNDQRHLEPESPPLGAADSGVNLQLIGLRVVTGRSCIAPSGRLISNPAGQQAHHHTSTELQWWSSRSASG